MKLDNKNYYSNKADWHFMSVSQFKNFMDCEAAALAELKGEWEPIRDEKPLLIGNYVHSYFESAKAHETFVKDNQSKMFSSRKPYGLLKDYKIADRMIGRLKSDDFFNFVYQGEKEAIVEGELFGAEWKGKIDCLNIEKGYFVDLKTSKNLYQRIYSLRYGHTVSFVEAYGYILQMAVYKILLEKQYRKEFTPYIFAVSKEETPDIAAIDIHPSRYDFEIYTVEELLPHILAVKKGEKQPHSCGRCAYCKQNKRLSGFIEVADLLG